MIIPEKEIEESISLNIKDEMNPEIGECFFHYSDENIYSKGFKEGVTFAESKIEEIAIEFLKYIENNFYYNSSVWVNCETDDYVSRCVLFEEFLKQKNEKN